MIRRWLRDLAERYLDRYEEGPVPPARLIEPVLDFCELHPEASREEWVAFAGRVAGWAYREGYARGWEATNRWERPWRRSPSPEEIADMEAPGWREVLHEP